MSEKQLIDALLTGKTYFGPAMRAMQSPAVRHQYLDAIVRVLSKSKSPGDFSILEIGSWAGASAITWAKAIQSLGKEGKITCVDQWRPYFEEGLETASHYHEMNEATTEGKIFKLFLHNLRAANVSHMVDYRIGDTRKILPELPSAAFDIVYIDGSHLFEFVHSDIKEAKRLIRDGGIVCGDDLELQRVEVDNGEHRTALALKKDFVHSCKAHADYHPGVTEAVALEFGEVSRWEGSWAARKSGAQWAKVELDGVALQIPDHVRMAPPALEAMEVGQTRDYLLIKVGESYIATVKSLGLTNLLVEHLGERELPPVLFCGDSFDEVRTKAIETEEERRPSVEVVDQTLSYNLVKTMGLYLAVAKRLGPTDLFQERLGERELAPLLFSSDSLEGVREKALAFEKEAAAPKVELVDEFGRYNIVKAGERFVAIARELGPVNLFQERLGERSLPPFLLTASELTALKQRIAKLI